MHDTCVLHNHLCERTSKALTSQQRPQLIHTQKQVRIFNILLYMRNLVTLNYQNYSIKLQESEELIDRYVMGQSLSRKLSKSSNAKRFSAKSVSEVF